MAEILPEILAVGASVSVTADGPATWSIGNELVRKTVEWRAGTGLCLAGLANLQSGHTWRPEISAGALAGSEFALTWNGAVLSGRQASVLRAVRGHAEDAAVTLHIDLELGGALAVTVCYRLHAGVAVIEQWLEVTALQGGTISRVAPLTVSAAGVPNPVLHWARGLQGHGWGMPASGPYPAFQIRHEPLGSVQLESGLRSTWHEFAWFAVDSNPTGDGAAGDLRAESSDGLFAGLLYSGRWSAHAEAHGPAGVPADVQPSVTLDVYSDGYAHPLAAGEHWTSPAGFLGVYHGDLDAAAHVQHAWLRTAVIPPTPEDFPWVQYNSWFAHTVDIDEEILRREADLAAQLGAEVFVIDAGWWEPSRRTSDNFTTGLGLWIPSKEKFPSGLRTFADYVRSLGMRFGIWVEPERVDIRRPGTWSDRWLARHHDAIISPAWPPDTVSGWLCFGPPEVQEWAIEWISELVTSTGAEWLKWDSNWWGVCTCDYHGHSPEDGELHQVQGVHTVLAELRRRFPHLKIENCAGGATRSDFAMLANSHVTWLHDASTPNRRVRFHAAGANYLFPPAVCNSFVIDWDAEPLDDPASPRADLDAIARSRMLGAYGVSGRLPQWTAEAFAAVQTAIAQYKQLRPALKHGRFYHLLPQADLECTELALHGQWEAYALLDPGAQSGALWAFRPADGDAVRTLPLKGLLPERRYTLEDVDTGQVETRSGAEWMEGGVRLDLAERTSALLWIRAAGA